MKLRHACLTVLCTALVGCGGADPVDGQGGLTINDTSGIVQLDISDVTLDRDGHTLMLTLALGGDEGSGECDMEAYPLEDEEYGSYAISMFYCQITAGDASWTTTPPSGQQQLDFRENSIFFMAGGDLLDTDARYGPNYQVIFEGTY